MKAWGLDVGERRVGLARTDDTGTLAVPQGVFPRRAALAEDVEALAKLLAARGAEALVVGLPRNMDGTEGPQAQKVREFAEALSRTSGLPVFYMDERWTTREVARAMREMGAKPHRRKEDLDALSAVLILQAWLDSRTRV